MAAVRMYFKKDDVDGWDFGRLTMQLWLKTTISTAFLEDSKRAGEEWDKADIPGLIAGFQKGEILFNIDQTVLFLRMVYKISNVLVSNEDEERRRYFDYIKHKTDRFKVAEEFEKYYLECSSQVLQEIREEFEKEPRLRGAFEKLICY